MAIILIALNIGLLTPVWVIWGLSVNSIRSPIAHFDGASTTTSTITTFPLVTWSVLLAYQIVMLLLMLPAAFTAFKLGCRSNMTSIVIRDGIIYYIYLIFLSLVGLVVMSLAPEYFAVLALYEMVTYAALSCRVVLHIREQAANNSEVHTISGV
ncbi:hypothetical protein BDQ17DRAFT_812144 [Cyathus striatus]|nr:hypothetical protein BDQ17DRAFT_812144 [Cyathus striatus]